MLPTDPKSWRTLATQPAFNNRWLSVVIDQVELPNGVHYEYTRLVGAGIGVGIIGFNAAGKILLEREYRHGAGEVVWQVPGGLAKFHEDLQSAGLRELEEETGYTPAVVDDDHVRYLGMVWDNPGFGVMCSHIYAVWNLQPSGHIRRDPEEFVTLHWVTPSWLKEAVRSGKIKDRVVVAALAYLMLHEMV
jgi:8-oxo-dGTP pyrophosphatase MutT (NUDIX family)